MATDLTRAQYAALIEDTIRILRADVDPQMPIQAVLMFLAVPMKGETSSTALQKAVPDIGQSSASRMLHLLEGVSKRKVGGGYGLIEAWDDPMDRRHRLVRMTDEGRVLMERLHTSAARLLDRMQQHSTERSNAP